MDVKEENTFWAPPLLCCSSKRLSYLGQEKLFCIDSKSLRHKLLVDRDEISIFQPEEGHPQHPAHHAVDLDARKNMLQVYKNYNYKGNFIGMNNIKISEKRCIMSRI